MIGSTVQRMRGLGRSGWRPSLRLPPRPLRPADPRRRGPRDGAADHPSGTNAATAERPPTTDDLARFSRPSLGVGSARETGRDALPLCAWELERLKEQPTDAVADRLNRERGLGPWSVGVVCLEGLGRYERGLQGDLGLVKLLGAMRGRRVEGWETAELLEPYGEWAGLASVYLLAGYAKGLLPVARAA
jgi:hypothetical protein